MSYKNSPCLGDMLVFGGVYFHEASVAFNCAKVKKLLVADLSKRFGNLKAVDGSMSFQRGSFFKFLFVGGKQKSPTTPCSWEFFFEVERRFPVCEDCLLYQVGSKI